MLRNDLFTKSSASFSASAAICANQAQLHYSTVEYVGGVIEFMDHDFIESFHGEIYSSGDPFEIGEFNISLVHWKEFIDDGSIVVVDCLPLSTVLRESGIRHVNFFILDVEVIKYYQCL